MGCGCNKNRNRRQSSRINTETTKLSPNQRRSKIVKLDNTKKKKAQTKFQKKQERNQKLWEQYRKK